MGGYCDAPKMSKQTFTTIYNIKLKEGMLGGIGFFFTYFYFVADRVMEFLDNSPFSP